MAELKNSNWQTDAMHDADFVSDSAAVQYGSGAAAEIPPPPPNDNWITTGAKPFPLPGKR